MNRIFNLHKDIFDDRDHLVAPPRLMMTGAPVKVDMSLKLGPVRDQGQAGSCTGNAGAGFMDWLYTEFAQYFPTKLPGAVEFSALFLYAEERLKNGTFPADSGSDSRTLFQVLNQHGICLDSADPYFDNRINQAPTAVQIAAAGLFKIGAYHRVLFDADLATAKSVLASGYCRTIGIPVYESIDSDEVAETGLLPVPTQLQTPIGAHELLVYGCDDSIKIGSSQGAELVRNSWGPAWGLGGNLRIPYGYYAAAGGNDTCDSWTGHMGKPWVPQATR